MLLRECNVSDDIPFDCHFAAGALLPLGFLSPMPVQNESKPEGTFRKTLRLSYQVVAILSLMSELVSVMWATVAVNQLTETRIAPAQSVW